MTVFDEATLLAAWDAAAGRPVAERGPWLVDRLVPTAGGVPALDLTVGTCDRLLAQLRGRLFGPSIDVISTCASCGRELECTIDLADLWPSRPDAVSDAGIEVVLDGRQMRCRPLSNRDLVELAALAPARRPAELVARCIGDDAPPATPSVVAQLTEVLATADPGSAALLDVACVCGARSEAELDIRSFLWAELSVWAEHLLTDVHRLASAYGWREDEILALPPRHRRAYLERCGW